MSFEEWFREKHGNFPWNPTDTTPQAMGRLAVGIAEYVTELQSRVTELERRIDALTGRDEVR